MHGREPSHYGLSGMPYNLFCLYPLASSGRFGWCQRRLLLGVLWQNGTWTVELSNALDPEMQLKRIRSHGVSGLLELGSAVAVVASVL